MHTTYWVHLAFVCISVLGLPSVSASSSLRRTTQKLPEVVDPDIAEAEALASQAEAEANGGSAVVLGDNAATAAAAAAAPADSAPLEGLPQVPAPEAEDQTAQSSGDDEEKKIYTAEEDVYTAGEAKDDDDTNGDGGSADAPAAEITPAPVAVRAVPHTIAKAAASAVHTIAKAAASAVVPEDHAIAQPIHLSAGTPRPWTAQSSKGAKAKHAHDVLAAGLHGGGLEHWGGAVVRAAVKTLAGNISKKAATVVTKKAARVDQPAKVQLPVHASAQAKNTMKDAATGTMDHHDTVRTAVRAAVKEVLPGERSRKALQRLKRVPGRVTRRVGEVAVGKAGVGHTQPQQSKAPLGKAGVTMGHTQPQQSKAPPGITEAEDDMDDPGAGPAMTYQVEPGLAYGHGAPHTTEEDQKALQEARQLEEQEDAEERKRELEDEAALMPHTSFGHPSQGARERRVLHEVEHLEEKIAEETKSQSLSWMLGGLKMDLYQLNEKVDMLHKDIEDGVTMDTGGIDEKIVYPLSTCMRCIFMLSAQYFILYTALAVCKAFVDMFDLGPDTTAERALRAGCDTVFFAPMLCVLFIGAHLRAVQITLGRKGPQDWAENAMQVCAFSCLIQTLMVLAIPIFSNNAGRDGGEAGSSAGFLTFMRYASLLGLYAGFIMVCVAVILMDARSLGARPVEVWDNPKTAQTEYAPPVSVAMICTISLTLFFFIVHLVHAVLWSCKELVREPVLSARPVGPSKKGARALVVSWEACLHSCTYVVNLAPMLCILFIVARMRALQMDPKWGRPQPWAEACFYACVGSVVAQTLLIIIARAIGGRSVTSARQEDEDSSVQQGPVHTLVLGFSYLVMGVTYVACGVIMASIFLIKAKNGSATPPLSPTMNCVMLLVVLYLAVNLCLFLAQGAVENSKQTSRSGEAPESSLRLLATCEMAENTVKFGPMLAVLFVGARMRALQMSNQQGSPQCWAQDAMYLASGAVVLQLFMVIASGAFSSTTEVDDTGALVASKVTWLPGRIFLECLKCVTFFMLFGGVFAVVASILIVRPETAQCAVRGFSGMSLVQGSFESFLL